MALTRNYPSVASIEVGICSASVNQNPKNQQEKRITSRKIFFSLFLERDQFMFDALISR